MGSINASEKSAHGGRPPGKIEASLNEKLQAVKWGEYKLGNLFERVDTQKLPYKAKDLPKEPTGDYVLPCLTSSFQNQGLNYYAPKAGATIIRNVISLPSNSDVYRAYYQSKDFTVLSDSYAIRWKLSENKPTPNQYLFMVMCINKVTDLPIYSYKNKLGGWNVVKHKKIRLPISEERIDFDFMETFIAELEAQRVAELEAYLTVSGYDNYELSDAELCALQAFKTVNWKSFNLEKLFGKATRGKRLKSADRVVGNLPFVTAGETFEGVSAHIGNEVEVFDANTTTIDMFGSAKYRSYKYGADDHIAVVHTDKLPIKASIFVTSAIHKASHTGKFDYGNNFYAKDADALDIMLPEKDGKPDYAYMELLISAIHKQVIKEVVLYSDQKIASTKEVISRTNQINY